MSDPTPTAVPKSLQIAGWIVPVNLGLFLFLLICRVMEPTISLILLVVFIGLAGLQFVLAIVGVCQVLARRQELGWTKTLYHTLRGLILAAGAVVGGYLGSTVLFFAGIAAAYLKSGGGAWGRPLRVGGRQTHACLAAMPGWVAGEQPCDDALDPATARALEALWLHDAQKEHASVPAFARITWLLTAAGAPADLLIWSHRAGLEEIDHAQRCFALAAGYGGRALGPLPMPELVSSLAWGTRAAAITLAVESVTDGCLLEDFNADVAAACAKVCTCAPTREVLLQIAREERSHAAFSWAVLRWTLEHHQALVMPALHQAVTALGSIQRPTAADDRVAELVAAADPDALLRHGRLPDTCWQELWDHRRVITEERLARLMDPQPALVA